MFALPLSAQPPAPSATSALPAAPSSPRRRLAQSTIGRPNSIRGQGYGVAAPGRIPRQMSEADRYRMRDALDGARDHRRGRSGPHLRRRRDRRDARGRRPRAAADAVAVAAGLVDREPALLPVVPPARPARPQRLPHLRPSDAAPAVSETAARGAARRGCCGLALAACGGSTGRRRRAVELADITPTMTSPLDNLGPTGTPGSTGPTGRDDDLDRRPSTSPPRTSAATTTSSTRGDDHDLDDGAGADQRRHRARRRRAPTTSTTTTPPSGNTTSGGVAAPAGSRRPTRSGRAARRL